VSDEEIVLARVEITSVMTADAPEDVHVQIEVDGNSGIIEVIGLIEMAKIQYLNSKRHNA
jgi:hypothetical protein